jgi:hypothetical protein
MGADGHIRFYDQGKVDRICSEINFKHGLEGNKRVHFPGYKCDFRVNGQPCYVIYWDSPGRKFNMRSKKGEVKSKKDMDSWHNWDFQETKAFLVIKKEFEDRCNAEAVLVEDQEVWT